MNLSALEICAGGGGQALGLEQAGFKCEAAVEIDGDACKTLKRNRPQWNVLHSDLKEFDASPFRGIDLLAGGVPCPPFSVAGQQLGPQDERDLFPTAIRLVRECNPSAVLLENVKGLSSKRFEAYRKGILRSLDHLGYDSKWEILFAKDFGVPQLRPRFVLVAIKKQYSSSFVMPAACYETTTVSDALFDLVSQDGWKGANRWKLKADKIAPTIVGGSKKHGGADLGPTRAKRQWAELGVDGRGIANEAPSIDTEENALFRLTLRMVARIQGFPDTWEFEGGKTSQYRQIGNAFPPPVAAATAETIRLALLGTPRNLMEGDQIEFPMAANF